MTRAIIFTRTKRGADKVTQHLDAVGIAALAIHGNKSQSQRERSLAAFRTGRVRALVATDIAARGIDIDGVTHVVNFELPEVAEAYVHRIGRTARAGAEGTAISLCDNAERELLRNIEKLTRLRLPALDRRANPNMARPTVDAPRAPARAGEAPGFGRPNRSPNAPSAHHRANERRSGARSPTASHESHASAGPDRPRFGSSNRKSEPRRGDGAAPSL